MLVMTKRGLSLGSLSAARTTSALMMTRIRSVEQRLGRKREVLDERDVRVTQTEIGPFPSVHANTGQRFFEQLR